MTEPLRAEAAGNTGVSELTNSPACPAQFPSLLSPRLLGRRSWSALTVWVLALVAIVSGFWCGWRQTGQEVSHAFLEVNPVSLQMGAIWAQDHFTWGVTVNNPSKETVHVSRIEASCSCISSVTPKSFSLNPNKHINIQITANLNHFLPPTSTVLDKIVNVSLYPVIAGSASRPEWKFTGRVIRPYVLSEMPDFGDSLVAGSPFPEKVLRIQCYRSLKRLEVTAPERIFTSNDSAPAPAVHNEYAIRLRPRCSLPVGTYFADLEVRVSDAMGCKHRLTPIHFSLRVVPDLQLLPMPLPLGLVEPGTRMACSFQLISRSGKSFRLLTTEIHGPELAVKLVSPDRQSALVNHCFDLEITPRTFATYSGKVFLKAQYADSALAVNVPLDVSYVGEFVRTCP